MSYVKPSEYRGKALKEKGESCHFCGSETNVQVHHIDGDRANNALENLLPVCPSHHGKIHKGSDGFEEWTAKILDEDNRQQLPSQDHLTTLKLEPDTRRRLKVWGAKQELTYDEGITELLDRAEAGGSE